MTRRGPALAVLTVVILAGFLGLFRLGATPLVDPDEGRYASAAAGMLETGDWIVPRFNGELRLNKPPLLYWLQASAMALLGRGEIGARLPSVMAGFLVVAALLLSARRQGEPAAGLLAALVVVTAPLAFGGFHLGVPDGLMTALVAAALLMALEVHEGRAAPRPAAALVGVALGLAVLTKGHVPLAVFALVEIGLLALRGGRPRFRPWALALGAALIVAIAAPWVAGVVMRMGWGPLRDTLAAEAGRLGSGGEHPEPWHYYLWRYPLVLLPWTGFFLAALRPAWRRRREPAVALALSWSLAPIVLFSLSSGKNNLYLMPALPGAALLVGLVWAGRGSAGALADRARLLAAALITAVLAAGGTAFLLLHHSSRPFFAGHRVEAAAVAALLSGAVLALAWTRRGWILTGAVALFAAGLLTAGLVVGPEVIAHGRSTRDLAEAYHALAGPEDDVVFYRTDASQHPSFVFYVGRPVAAAWRTFELREARRREGLTYLVCGDDDHARLVPQEIVRWEGPLASVRELALFREARAPERSLFPDIELEPAD